MAFLYAFLGISALFFIPLFFSVSAYFDMSRDIAFFELKLYGMIIYRTAIRQENGKIMVLEDGRFTLIKQENRVDKGVILYMLKAFKLTKLTARAKIDAGDAAATALICGAAKALNGKYDVVATADYDGNTAASVEANLYLIPIKGVIYGIRTIKNNV